MKNVCFEHVPTAHEEYKDYIVQTWTTKESQSSTMARILISGGAHMQSQLSGRSRQENSKSRAYLGNLDAVTTKKEETWLSAKLWVQSGVGRRRAEEAKRINKESVLVSKEKGLRKLYRCFFTLKCKRCQLDGTDIRKRHKSPDGYFQI